MRMHRKSHLEERLAACSDILTVADLKEKNMSVAAITPDILPVERIFGRTAPIHLEVGCGKGGFIIQMAKNHPDTDFIAVEKISNVLIEALENTKSQGITNIRYLNCAAEVLPRYFKEGAISRIYLNFSNPLPKEGYKKQRLTHPKFLEMYKRLLTCGGDIIQKTDDRDFYLFSLESFLSCGFKIAQTCEDLAANPVEGDVETEHERLFKSRGKKIYRTVAVKI